MDRIGIESWLSTYSIFRYTINEDMSVDVDGGVDLINKNLTELPVRFRNVSGYFSCGKNKLTSLVGCPTIVGDGFYCNDNNLTSLVGGPISVGVDFYCYGNQLTSLVGCPVSVSGDFNCHKNKLTTFKGGPEVIDGSFYCGVNELSSLEGCPVVGNLLDCNDNRFNAAELFLYDYTYEQVRQYYDSKNLNIKLNNCLDVENDLSVKKRKI